MKKVYFFVLFFYGVVNAQIITIPDANFKAMLLMANSNNSNIAGTVSSDGTYYNLGATIDLNGDGEIEVSEAQSIHYLALPFIGPDNVVHDLTGLEYFTNLVFFSCSQNDLPSLDLSPLTHLKMIGCSNNHITNLNLDGLLELQYLSFNYNQITSFDFSGLPNLKSVLCKGNLLTSLDFSNNPLFFDLACAENSQLTYINLKNGAVQNNAIGYMWFDGFVNCPNLHNICVDEDERVPLQNTLDWVELNLNGSHIECSATCLLAANESQQYNTIRFFPNPTQGLVRIDSQYTIKSIQISDMNGRVFTPKIHNEIAYTLDISEYAKGIYLIKVATEKGFVTQKIIKE